MESFRSTLEEVVDADLLVHVVDASSPESDRQIEAVRTVLRELGAGEIPELLVANKLDLATPEQVAVLRGGGAVPVSAVTGAGAEKLLDVLADRLRALNLVVELECPCGGDVLAALHREGEVLVEVHDDHATRVRARLPTAGWIASGSSWRPECRAPRPAGSCGRCHAFRAARLTSVT